MLVDICKTNETALSSYVIHLKPLTRTRFKGGLRVKLHAQMGFKRQIYWYYPFRLASNGWCCFCFCCRSLDCCLVFCSLFISAAMRLSVWAVDCSSRLFKSWALCSLSRVSCNHSACTRLSSSALCSKFLIFSSVWISLWRFLSSFFLFLISLRSTSFDS